MPVTENTIPKTNLNLCYRAKADIVTRDIANETWLIPISGQLADLEQLYHLNNVGAFIWRCLDGKTSIQAIREKLISNYEVSAKQAATDISIQIAELLEAGLLIEVT